MSFFNKNIALKWEWSANRAIKYRIEVEVLEINAFKKLISSPSFAANLPAPMSFRGRVKKGGHLKDGVVFEINIPKIDLEGIYKGSSVFFGMIDNETVICIQSIPTGLSESEKSKWLESVECKK